MSPLKIEMMLHYYACCEDYREGDFSASAVGEALDEFLASDMLRATEPGAPYAKYEITRKGRFYVEYLCSVPLPESTFRIVHPSDVVKRYSGDYNLTVTEGEEL